MLARVEDLGGVDHAKIDYRGEFLRLSVTDDRGLAAVTDLLRQLGYQAERVDEVEVQAVTRWYDTESVGDLSRVEASVIAERILPSFVLSRKLTADQLDSVRSAVVNALHSCFVSAALASGPSLGAFRRSCVRAVEESLSPIVGPASARILADLLNADLNQDRR